MFSIQLVGSYISKGKSHFHGDFVFLSPQSWSIDFEFFPTYYMLKFVIMSTKRNHLCNVNDAFALSLKHLNLMEIIRSWLLRHGSSALNF